MKTLNEWKVWVAALLVAEFAATGLAWRILIEAEYSYRLVQCQVPVCWSLWLARLITGGLGIMFGATLVVVLWGLYRINKAMYQGEPSIDA